MKKVELKTVEQVSAAMRDIRKIETSVWEKNPHTGYLMKVRNRTVMEVARDLEKALDKAGLPYEYVSPTVSHASIVKDMEKTEWPNSGETFVSLEMGGNEGYAVQVYVRLGMFVGGVLAKTQIVNPIRVKLLTTREEALLVHAFVWHLLGS